MKTLLKCLLAVITVTIVMYLVGCFIWDTTDTGQWSEAGRWVIAIIWGLLNFIILFIIIVTPKIREL